MTTKTITWVSDISTTADMHGNHYVNVSFDDDTVAFKGGKPDTIMEHHAALAALVDKPSEFMLESAGQSKKGKEKFKIVGYPGWEASSVGGGGGGGGGKSWYNSEEGVRFTQDSIQRSVAMKLALKVHGDAPELEAFAERLYTWLRASAPTTEETPRTAPHESGGAGTSVGAPSPAEVRTSGANRGEGAPDTGAEGQSRATDPTPPSHNPIRHAQLFANLTDFAGGPKRALNLVNKSTKSSYQDASEIPEQVLEDVIRTFAIGEMA